MHSESAHEPKSGIGLFPCAGRAATYICGLDVPEATAIRRACVSKAPSEPNWSPIPPSRRQRTRAGSRMMLLPASTFMQMVTSAPCDAGDSVSTKIPPRLTSQAVPSNADALPNTSNVIGQRSGFAVRISSLKMVSCHPTLPLNRGKVPAAIRPARTRRGWGRPCR